MAVNPEAITTCSEGNLLYRVDPIRRTIPGRDNDVRTLLGFQLDDTIAEIRRRNEARAKAIADARLS